MRKSWEIAAILLFTQALTGLAQESDDASHFWNPQLIPESAPVISEEPAKPGPKLWTGSLELGLNGSSGNSEVFNMRFGGKVKRETAYNILTSDWLYRYNRSAGELAENRALLNGKSEWPIGESPWDLFVSGFAEYDEFKEFNIRLAAHAGLGYQFIKTDRTQFKARIGGGASREIGGKDNNTVPEALFGLEAEHQITIQQKITASIEYFPNVTRFGDFRSIAKAAYEFLVDPEWNITFKLGVLDRYDSTPQGKKPNDFEFFATVLWAF